MHSATRSVPVEVAGVEHVDVDGVGDAGEAAVGEGAPHHRRANHRLGVVGGEPALDL
jgi:hypothetical protein